MILLVACLHRAEGPPPRRGVVLEAQELWVEDRGLELREGQVVEVLGRSDGLGKPELDIAYRESWTVRLEGLTFELPGERLAVEILSGEPGWVGARPRVPGAWWAMRESWEWNDKLEEWDRRHVDGWLVTGGGASFMVYDHAWGTARWILDAWVHDLGGDGRKELLLHLQDSIAEAGAAGQTLMVLELATGAPVLELRVDDPLRDGLDTQDRWGWVDVDLRSGTVKKGWVERVACGEAECLEWHGRAWSFADSVPVERTRWDGPLVVGVLPGPLHASPAGPVLKQDFALLGCVGQVEGEIGVSKPFWVQVMETPCQGGGGWVPSDRVLLCDDCPTLGFGSARGPDEGYLRVAGGQRMVDDNP